MDAEAVPAWEVMLAAAAVRLINYFVPTTELANQIALEDGLGARALPASPAFSAAAAAPSSAPSRWGSFFSVASNAAAAQPEGGAR